MSAKFLLECTNLAELALGASVLGVLWYRRALREYLSLSCFLAARTLTLCVVVPLLFFRREIGISVDKAYTTYFYTAWVATIVHPILVVLVLYSIYQVAMKPLQGLHSIGKMVFRWVGSVSIMVSLGVALGPHLFSSNFTATSLVTNVYAQIQQATSVLSLCLLLFVCFATRPLGLTYRSRIFGVSLGLGVMAAATLLEAAWFSTSNAHSLYSPIYLVSAIGFCVSQLVWLTYFGLPEAERKMILLPTTSPFFFWNRVSEALGDNPGYVAVAGFTPEMLASAELKVLSAASASARERRRLAELAPPPETIAAPMPASLFATK
jgi:hypothetical protein